MYIKFQQNRISRSVKTVNTKLFANSRKLHKFATCSSNFETRQKCLSEEQPTNIGHVTIASITHTICSGQTMLFIVVINFVYGPKNHLVSKMVICA